LGYEVAELVNHGATGAELTTSGILSVHDVYLKAPLRLTDVGRWQLLAQFSEEGGKPGDRCSTVHGIKVLVVNLFQLVVSHTSRVPVNIVRNTSAPSCSKTGQRRGLPWDKV